MLAHETNVLWAPTHPPSLTFCSSSSKAKLEAMQEIQDNTSVDPCSGLPNESISKSRFSMINTNSYITPPNNLDMVTFEFLLTCDFVSTKA
jgi:hypothetical protein